MNRRARLARTLLAGAAALFIMCFPVAGRALAGGRNVDPVVIRSVHGNFNTVWEDLNMALTDRGLVVSGVSHVQKMLDRTGKALGRTKKIFVRGKVLEFCSAVVSRDMMEQNPHFIAFCPYRIAVYTLPGHEKTVYLSYVRPVWERGGNKSALREVDSLLDGIVNSVINKGF